MGVGASVHVCVCVRACVRACVRVCVCVCVLRIVSTDKILRYIITLFYFIIIKRKSFEQAIHKLPLFVL